MGRRVDQFCDELRDRLRSVESRVNHLKANIGGDREATKAAIDRKIDEAKAGLNGRKDDVEAARARMQARLEAKQTETEDRIAEWKLNRESEKLERRAEDSEAYAAWAILVAAAAIGEADLAALEAIEARVDADRLCHS